MKNSGSFFLSVQGSKQKELKSGTPLHHIQKLFDKSGSYLKLDEIEIIVEFDNLD